MAYRLRRSMFVGSVLCENLASPRALELWCAPFTKIGLYTSDQTRYNWVVHSGGKRVLDSIDRALGFVNGELENSRIVLRHYGNMSSSTILFVLKRVMRDAQAGELGVLVALGPGLAAETGIVRW